jgi:carbamoyl-phosphate synthase large subunit
MMARPRTEHRPNVLITSASRKVLLVRAFRDALASLGGGRVLAADVSPLSAALLEADAARLVPRSDSQGFVAALSRLCREEAIGLIVPTRDEELPILAAARDNFVDQGTLILVSAPAAIEVCRDKVRFGAAARAAGLDTPRIYDDPATAPLPAFVKARTGKGAWGAATVRTREAMLAAVAALDGDAVVQELIEAPEYTIDVFVDLDGRPISCIPRERIAVIGGESSSLERFSIEPWLPRPCNS